MLEGKYEVVRTTTGEESLKRHVGVAPNVTAARPRRGAGMCYTKRNPRSLQGRRCPRASTFSNCTRQGSL